MAPLSFAAGVLFTLAFIILMLPWLRTVPGLGALPALPWQAGAAAAVTLSLVTGFWLLRNPDPSVATHTPAARDVAGNTAPVADNADDSWAGIANALRHGNGTTANTNGSSTQSGAQPMAGAIASLQARLSKGGGSADDWELLAKSYEFLGRPTEAAKARAHQLPPLPVQGTQ